MSTIVNNPKMSLAFVDRKPCSTTLSCWRYQWVDFIENTDVLRLYFGCFVAVLPLSLGCLTAVSRLYNGCIAVVQRLYLGCTTAVLRLYNGCISAVSRLYNGCTSVVQRLYCCCFAAVIRLFYGCIIFYGTTLGKWYSRKLFGIIKNFGHIIRSHFLNRFNSCLFTFKE